MRAKNKVDRNHAVFIERTREGKFAVETHTQSERERERDHIILHCTFPESSKG